MQISCTSFFIFFYLLLKDSKAKQILSWAINSNCKSANLNKT